MPHFRATVELLHDYHALPMPTNTAKVPQVTLVWAGETPFDGVRYTRLPGALNQDDQESDGMKFLTHRRTDFGPGGWAKLFPNGNITVEVLKGEHHFSMMRGEGAVKLGQLMREALVVD